MSVQDVSEVVLQALMLAALLVWAVKIRRLADRCERLELQGEQPGRPYDDDERTC